MASSRLEPRRNHLPPEITVYGSGAFGRRLAKAFELAGTRVLGFTDRSRQAPAGYVSLSISEALDAGVPLVVGIHNPGVDLRPLVTDLHEAGFEEILNPVEAAVALHDSGFQFENYWLTGDIDLYRESSADQESAREGLHDARSRELFDQTIAFRSRGLLEAASNPDPVDEQYLPVGIPFVGPKMRYVDIGGFDGDTVRSLKMIPDALSAIVSFEPDPTNFDKLSREISTLDLAEGVALPMALGAKLEMLSFDANSDSSASVSASGQVKVQSASFDSLFPNWRPSHIKMDVEGAEPDVIEGMKNTILKFRPALAISVYHSPRHHWSIQQRIQEFELDYCFFMRSYAFQTFETVLYCLPKEAIESL